MRTDIREGKGSNLTKVRAGSDEDTGGSVKCFRAAMGRFTNTKLQLRKNPQTVVPFGEEVLARRLGAHLKKGESWYVNGMGWAGRAVGRAQHQFKFRSRSVRRLPPDWCWCKDAVDSMTWTPWKTASIMRGRRPRQSSTGKPIVNSLLPTIKPRGGSRRSNRNSPRRNHDDDSSLPGCLRRRTHEPTRHPCVIHK